MTEPTVPNRVPWKTMLVPTDFSAGARSALSLAADLAKVHGARLVVLHVAELLPGLTADTMVHAEGGVPMRLEDFHRAQTLAWMEQDRALAHAREVPVDLVFVLGEVVPAVLAEATLRHADVIVMGTHGRSGLAHFVMGSVAERVLRQSKVPVLTVRVPDSP
jgi:nucleotide-binding universal stress UspA family protein